MNEKQWTGRVTITGDDSLGLKGTLDGCLGGRVENCGSTEAPAPKVSPPVDRIKAGKSSGLRGFIQYWLGITFIFDSLTGIYERTSVTSGRLSANIDRTNRLGERVERACSSGDRDSKELHDKIASLNDYINRACVEGARQDSALDVKINKACDEGDRQNKVLREKIDCLNIGGKVINVGLDETKEKVGALASLFGSFRAELKSWRDQCNEVLTKVQDQVDIVTKRADVQRDNIQKLVRKMDWLKAQIDNKGYLSYNNDIRTELENLSKRITVLESRQDRRADAQSDRLDFQSRKLQAILDYSKLTYNHGTNTVERLKK